MFLKADSQSCINNPDVNQIGEVTVQQGRQVVVPDANFSCNGRITNVAVSMRFSGFATDFPLFQVWHPSSPGSSVYNKTAEVQLPGGDFIGNLREIYYLANVSLSDGKQIEFQSGDIIGYHQPADPRRLVWSIQTSGYTAYSNSVASSMNIIDISNADNVDNEHQPLVAIMFGKFCLICTYLSIHPSIHLSVSVYVTRFVKGVSHTHLIIFTYFSDS